jgi:lipid-A-disaccharide synthase
LIERLGELRPDEAEQARRNEAPFPLVVLPGSRRSEIDRLMPVFGGALSRIARAVSVEAVLPAVSRHRGRIEELARGWDVPVRLVAGEADKYAAFRTGRAALAASGTVTLELALAGVPTVVGYKVSRIEEFIARRLIQVPSIVLPNLILGRNAMPEFVQAECTPERLAAALLPLLQGGEAREAQSAALERMDELTILPDGDTPSRAAARVVLAVIGERRPLR